jgi:hypothetical protein
MLVEVVGDDMLKLFDLAIKRCDDVADRTLNRRRQPRHLLPVALLLTHCFQTSQTANQGLQRPQLRRGRDTRCWAQGLAEAR